MLPDNQIEPEFGARRQGHLGWIFSPGDKPMVMRGPMLHQIIRQFLQQVEWGELDFLVVDLPPGTGDVVISLVQTVPLTGAVVVSTPSDVALQDARKALEMFHQVNVPILGMVENMSHFSCPHCRQEIDIFSKGGAERTAKQFNVPFLGSIELDPDIRQGGDTGLPVALAGPDSAEGERSSMRLRARLRNWLRRSRRRWRTSSKSARDWPSRHTRLSAPSWHGIGGPPAGRGILFTQRLAIRDDLVLCSCGQSGPAESTCGFVPRGRVLSR